MLDERLGWCLVFDGRLDNGPDLRENLDECFPFRSGSDAEVVLAAYHRWGEHFVDHLQGVFALALVDAPREKVLLARDRQGARPLYLGTGAGRLRFASTLPGLMAADGTDTVVDRAAEEPDLDHRGLAAAQQTVLSGVTLLPAATLRVLEARGRARDRAFLNDEAVPRLGSVGRN
jgi:asparagine synthase (glutamine-hydrolysing)